VGRRVVTALLAAGLLLADAPAAADGASDRRRPCVRASEKRVLRDGNVVVARRMKKTRDGGFQARVFTCWRPTRLRTFIGWEADEPYSGGDSLEIHVVDRRYVGVRASHVDPVVWLDSVKLYDVRRGRLLHRSTICREGRRVWDAVFLPGGGVAYSCDTPQGGLYLLRGPAQALETLEADAYVEELATEADAAGALWLTWHVVTPSGFVPKRLQLSPLPSDTAPEP